VFKTIGYAISSVSVILLGVVAWDGAKDHPPLLAALMIGVITSIVGMYLRWASWLRNEKPSQWPATAFLSRRLEEVAPKPAPAPDRHGSEARRPRGR
jgi:hypothetical protein